MTDQEINTAIAECCGWRVKLTHPESKYAPWSLIAPSGNTIVDCTDENDGWNQTHRYPDYTLDLNAIHTAESIFDGKTCDERSLWLDHLGLVVGWKNSKKPAEARFECTYLTARASARQRAEAFLRTLGKWKE